MIVGHVVKRFCEPPFARRTWKVWWFDTSKQALGALVIHFINILIAEFFGGIDPCTQYIISFVLDSTFGLLIIYIGIKVTQFIAVWKGCEFLIFGVYGKPKPRFRFWYYQTLTYIGIAIIAKIFVTILLQFKFWAEVQKFLLWPIPNPEVEVTLVVLVIPFIINCVMFWVTDNFLTMDRSQRAAATSGTETSSKSITSSSKLSFLKMPFRVPVLRFWRRGRDDDDAGLIEVSMEQNPFALRT